VTQEAEYKVGTPERSEGEFNSPEISRDDLAARVGELFSRGVPGVWFSCASAASR
jgi:hypothetical protein